MNLNQVTISVKNVEQSILFYQKLGLNLIVKSLPEYARFECINGDATFSLHRNEELNNGTWIYFEVDNVDVKISQLLENDFIINDLPEDKPWLWREARLKDLDNNIIIIYNAGSNRKSPPWLI
ncbi:MAG: VOC family protein [Flavobacterium sp.]|uniref:VOC family protein n=1 Tax=Flavobacterium sp. TaxID=239 RepID=UPI0032663DA3